MIRMSDAAFRFFVARMRPWTRRERYAALGHWPAFGVESRLHLRITIDATQIHCKVPTAKEHLKAVKLPQKDL